MMSQSGNEAGSHSGRLGASWTADVCWASVATSLAGSSDTLETPCDGLQHRGKTRPAGRRRDGDAKLLRSVSRQRGKRLALYFGRRLQDGCAVHGPHICSLIKFGRLVPLSNALDHENACINHEVKNEKVRPQISGSGMISNHILARKQLSTLSKDIEWRY